MWPRSGIDQDTASAEQALRLNEISGLIQNIAGNSPIYNERFLRYNECV